MGRRARILARWVAMVAPAGELLDVGAGDGRLAAEVARLRTDVRVRGTDSHARPNPAIPIDVCESGPLPYADRSFDAVMAIDVLHHTDDPSVLLGEMARVSRRHLIIKDHRCESGADRSVLRFMDDVGNRRHGVRLPHVYWSQARWQEAFRALGLVVIRQEARLGLYPWPAGWIFERALHFLAVLEKRN